jgi:membrane-bound lytic murein transglycosylase D
MSGFSPQLLTLWISLGAAAAPSDEVALLHRLADGPPPASASMPHIGTGMHPRTAQWMGWFVGDGRTTFEGWLGRHQRDRELIGRLLRDAEVPAWLSWVPVVESGLLPRAVSTIGATGPWQFLGVTADQMKLRRDSHVDERADLEASTRAAARLLSQLHHRFGDWELSLIAWNAGPERLDAALALAGSRDWKALGTQHGLSPEALHFVPKVHAARALGENPERYTLAPKPTQARAAMVRIRVGEVPWAALATCAGVSEQALLELNPALLSASLPPGGWWVHVPAVGDVSTCLAAARP